MNKRLFTPGSTTYNPKKRMIKKYKPKNMSYLKKRLTVETKSLDTSNIQLRFDNNSALANVMQYLNPVAVSGGPNGRIGKKINGKAIHIRGTILTASASTMYKCAIVLIYVRNNNLSALPPVTDIFTTQDSNSLTSLQNASKFKIVRRWEYSVIGNSTTPSTGNELIVFDEYIKLKDTKYVTLYTQAGSSGVITECQEGAFLLLTLGSASYGATTTPIFDCETRYYFDDI